MNQSISHYRILERLGVGAMGEVYKAEDLRLRRLVALKRLHADRLTDPWARQRLLEEAQHAAALTHPHIAIVHEVIHSEGECCMVMEYLPGETLAHKLERGPLEIPEVLKIAKQVAEALQAAHEHGLIHCDLSSSNVMLMPDGNVKVLDFGLSQMTRSGSSGGHTLPETTRGWSGTMGALSPEQAKGECLDARTDLFSLGILLYEMVSGRRPFESGTLNDSLHSLLNDSSPPLSSLRDDVPLELESMGRRLLGKNRADRYPSASALIADLKHLEEQLESRRPFYDSSDSKAPPSSLHDEKARRLPPALDLPVRWRAFLHRHREIFLTGALLSISVAAMDYFHFYPRGGITAWETVLLMIALFSSLCFVIAGRSRPRSISELPQGAAFRGLLPFQEADRDRFFGRETDKLALFDLLAHGDFRFGVLFGESGCGKTSLLRAGLLPKLWDEGYVPVYTRSYKGPLASLMEECQRRTQIRPRENESPLDYLRRVGEEMNATVVVVCDQFEEFFVNFKTPQEREPFLRFVAICHHAPRLAVKFLFSMRSDFLYLINSEFGDKVPEPLMSSRLYHLRNFDEDQASEIIRRSAQRAHLPLEAGLVRQVAKDLVEDGRVLPSELQIIGDQIQNKRIFTIHEYRRAGGKEALVHRFLEDVIQASGDREVAGLLLRSLISDENTRLTLPLEEIARRTQRGRETIERILKLFVGARLVAEIQEDDPWRYELMHEYLIEKVNRITGKVMDATQRANRFLRQYLSDYALDKSTRIPVGKLWFIRRYSDLSRGERERELLSKSWRWGAIKAGLVALVLVAAVTVTAAALSVQEEWDGTRLADGHTAAVRQAVFSPDGRLLASAGEDSTVIVWDFARRQRIITLRDHTGWVSSVAFSPDGKWLAAASYDKTVVVWEVEQMKKVAVLREHQSPVHAVVFSPNGQWLVSCGEKAFVWAVGTWRKYRELPLNMSYGTLLFSPDCRQVMAADGTACDIKTGVVTTASLSLAEMGGSYAALSPDASRMVTVDGIGDVKFLELPRRGDLSKRKLLYHQDVHEDHGRAIAYSPDGRWVASGSENIVLWDALKMQKVARLQHTAIVWSLAFSPDGRWLISTHGDGAILLWDVAERERVADLNEHTGPVRAVAFSWDGKQIASASEDHSVIVWDASRRQKITVLIGHKTRVMGVVFSPDGNSIASLDQDSTLILWDLKQSRPRQFLNPRTPELMPAYILAISPDGRWLSSTTGVFDSTNGRAVLEWASDLHHRGMGSIYGQDFSSDGRWLVSVADSGHISLWEVGKWKEVETVRLEGAQLICTRFSPDGRWLVTGEDEGFVRLWRIGPLREVAVLGHHSARIKSVAFSPDGKEVASAGDDQTVALWNVQQRRLITRIGSHSAPVLSIAFSPDGKRLVTGEHDRSVHLYTRRHLLWGYRLD